ncbi:hypothetical protein C8R43DRAFT_1126842 [Mycena crocata]|nr:hypothetical protein C8R43DRAFT_1126842 [Mycena crocata]
MSRSFHLGTFLLFAATGLLIVASISAPTIAQIEFLHVGVANGSSVNFGSLGFCILTRDDNLCTPTALGYKIADEISAIGFGDISDASATSLHGLTEAFILHQIAAGIAGMAFLMAACSDRLGYLFASLVAFFAFLISLAAVIIDFIVFGFIRNHVNKMDGSAAFGKAIWMVLAATAVLFIGSIATCFACAPPLPLPDILNLIIL